MNRSFASGILIGLVMAVCVFIGFAVARLDSGILEQAPTATPLPTIAPSVTPFVLSDDILTSTLSDILTDTLASTDTSDTIESTDTLASTGTSDTIESTDTSAAAATNTPMPTISPTLPPSSPLPTLTPSQTLKPPPTFEPPTATLRPTITPTQTATSGRLVAATFPSGIQGIDAEFNDGVEVDPGTCEKNEDWKLRYTVQPGDALSNIAARYGTLATELAVANCLEDVNTIISGQILRVPGETQPVDEIVCDEWEVLTPFDGAYTIDGDTTISFVWRGPVADRYLVRVVQPSGKIWEQLIDKKQNTTVFLPAELREEGNHHWYVYPLGLDFLQIPCTEGGPWYFHKFAPTIALTLTPSITPEVTNTPEDEDEEG